MKWISVKDRLPKNRSEVLIHCKDGTYDLCYYRDSIEEFSNLSGERYHPYDMAELGLGEVSHWMELPEPPKTNYEK